VQGLELLVALRPTFRAEVFYGFLESLQANAGMVYRSEDYLLLPHNLYLAIPPSARRHAT
jgi:hypothetical protein